MELSFSNAERKGLSDKQYCLVAISFAVLNAFTDHLRIFDIAVSLLWFLLALFLLRSDDFFTLLIPLTIFENNLFFLGSSYSLFKIFVLLYCVKWFFSKKKITRFDLLIYGAFCLLYGLLNLMRILNSVISLIIFAATMLALFDNLERLRSPVIFRRMMTLYLALCLSAGAYGFLTGNSIYILQNGIYLNRFCGTAPDPNIMSYKWSVALIFSISCSWIPTKLKWLLCLIFSGFILASGSMTALLSIVFAMIVWMLLTFKKHRGLSIALITVLFFVVILLPVIADSSVFISSSSTGFGARITQKISDLLSGDISAFTTYRSDVVEDFMSYYNRQDFFGKMLGGNIVNVYGVDRVYTTVPDIMVPHNIHVDMLMCIGWLGWLIALFSLFRSILLAFRKAKESDWRDISPVLIKTVMLVYSVSLSMFLSAGFMGFLLC